MATVNLNKQRGSIKTRLTIAEKFINEKKAIFDANNELTPEDVIQVQIRSQALQPLLGLFEQVQLQIENISEDVDNEVQHLESFQNKYYNVVAVAQSMLRKIEHSNASNNRVNSSASHEIAPSQTVASVASVEGSTLQTSIKLPRVSIPDFDGKSEGWLNFRDIFCSLINNNNSLSDIQKHQYLRSALVGKAKEVVKNIALTASNYKIVWDNLNSRYNKPRSLVHHHVKALCNLPAVTKESSTKLLSLVDNYKNNLRAIASIIEEDEQRNAFLVYLLSSKLDDTTLLLFENSFNSDAIPDLENLIDFVEKRASRLENVEQRDNKVRVERSSSKSFVSTVMSCPMCDGSHILSACDAFIGLDANTRSVKVREFRICFNCLTKGHFTGRCKSKMKCQKCKSKHHTLLHVDRNSQSVISNPPAVSQEENVTVSAFSSSRETVLLCTAMVRVLDVTGRAHAARILLDSGSMSSFITEDFSRNLGLERTSSKFSVSGISNRSTETNSKCSVKIISGNSRFQLEVDCLVMPSISGNIPTLIVDRNSLNIPNNLHLADRNFHIPGKVDILLGASHFWQVVCVGQHTLGKGKPILQKTRFGWVVSGPIQVSLQSPVSICNFSQTAELSKELKKFWETEEVFTTNPLSEEEQFCERHFVETHRRDGEGRFVVSIPFKESLNDLGDSYEQAKRRFLNLERKFNSNQSLAIKYKAFMQEYVALGHMSAVVNGESTAKAYYIPHHGVSKESSLTTSLRVVFDASMASTSGVSVNDLQMIGPVIQSDLFSILIRFRKYAVALSADIAKFYRQVLVEPEQRSFQRIIWRDNATEALNTYELNTVTYGTASASFLAIRSLMQLGIECQQMHPEISKIIQEGFYVDDLLTGANTVEEARRICKTLPIILKGGCFELRKWISNTPEALVDLHQADVHPNVLSFGQNERTKTLGLSWSCAGDKFHYSISLPQCSKLTKRSILSEISQVFDPLGLLSPCTITAKAFIQQLWLEKVSWDESLSQALQSKWLNFRSELIKLNQLEISRYVLVTKRVRLELHGFSDASNIAYGACLYTRSIDEQGQAITNLLCAKTKVAPLKTITIPRLELSAALMLTRLFSRVRSIMGVEFNRCYLWSDSSIVLGWLKTPPNLLKTFVANRVAEIQESTHDSIWRHVPTKSNPADMPSRGITPSELLISELWWHGPSWLSLPEESWPDKILSPEIVPELKESVNSFITIEKLSFPFHEYSDLSKLERIIAYCFRFTKNCTKLSNERVIGPLSYEEIRRAQNCLVKVAQGESFEDELQSLKEGVDYAGPILLRDRKGRGCKTVKAYIAVFVCFSTKALHLELVTELTTNAFIAALRRFCARRGRPRDLHSDNGKNFVGANAELKQLFAFLRENHNDIATLSSELEINWHFIPAYSPHFGGLWEAGVKSVKYHIKRVAGNALLTYEEMYTLLTQIESILNSRPLCPLSSDPNDLDPLTPAHFLLGRTLVSVPDADVSDIPPTRLDYYQRVQQLQQHFWKRWHKEYMAELQHRAKWKRNVGAVKLGDCVLVKDSNSPPLVWKMGRVIATHPGKDNIVRVATLKTINGILKRAVTKLCPLPNQ